MLIVGFGGGVVVEGVPPTVQRIDVIELEPQGHRGEPRHARPAQARSARRSARQPHRRTTRAARCGSLTRRYDAIVSQPSHPWTAGASHLYTREFMQLAHDHLTPDGVFVQWMNVIFMDEDLLRSLTATLLSVFQEVRVYRPDPQHHRVPRQRPRRSTSSSSSRATGLPLRDAPLHYARFGINNAEDLVAALVLDADGARRFAAGAPLITDDDNRIATSSVYERGRGLNGDTQRPAARARTIRCSGAIRGLRQLRDRLSFPYIARRNGVFVLLDPSLTGPRRRAWRRSSAESADGEYVRAFYSTACSRDQQRSRRTPAPGHRRISGRRPRCARNSCAPGFGDLAHGKAPPEIAEIAAGLEAPARILLDAARHAAKADWRRRRAGRRRTRGDSVDRRLVSRGARLRVNWRTRVTNDGESQALRRRGDSR